MAAASATRLLPVAGKTYKAPPIPSGSGLGGLYVGYTSGEILMKEGGYFDVTIFVECGGYMGGGTYEDELYHAHFQPCEGDAMAWKLDPDTVQKLSRPRMRAGYNSVITPGRCTVRTDINELVFDFELKYLSSEHSSTEVKTLKLHFKVSHWASFDPTPAGMKGIEGIGFLLASVTEDEYANTVKLYDAYQGDKQNATGLAGDFLNKTAVYEVKLAWRTKMWLKLIHAIEELERKDLDIVAVCVAGGRACDWERWHMTTGVKGVDDEGMVRYEPNFPLETHIRTKYDRENPKLHLKVVTNASDLEKFIQRGMPLEECS